LIASFGVWFLSRPVTHRFSYGFGRAEFLMAFINGLLMLAVVSAVVYHAIERITQPLDVKGEVVTLVAVIGLLLNVLVLYLLKHGESDLNRRAAILHVMADLLASIAHWFRV
jgi:cobalt-zinc-cadmium efflux system protein